MANNWGKRALLPISVGFLAFTVGCNSGFKVEVTEKDRFDTAGNMFAYAEFELSGEPLAESLGLDLDLLDVNKLDQPGKFDYAAGVESYEYSEEGMYEVVEKSGLGLHLVSGPEVLAIAKQQGVTPNEALVARLQKLAESVGYPMEEIHQGMYPTLIEYAEGDPHYAQGVDTKKFADGEDGAYVPKFQIDFSTLRWDRSKMDKTLVPAAYGATLLKQALWAGDFLGNVHAVDSDEELDAAAANPDQDSNVALGVSSVDGMQGMILTEEMWNKLSFIRQGMFVDAATGKLTPGTGAAYDASQGFVYLPHAVSVTEDDNKDYPGVGSLEVKDARSLLRDQWLMLWPSSEYYGMVDQRPANPNRNPAFGYAFDGSPFPSAPAANVDDNPANDVASSDPYTVGRDVMMQVFRNMAAMHWNDAGGWLASEHDGKRMGTAGSTFDAGYAMESLRMFQRAVDGLPVGYANGEGAEGLHTEEGKQALDMIKRQADFLIGNVIRSDGLAANGWNAEGKADESAPTLLAQTGAIRGLASAYLATEDEKYRTAARGIFDAVDRLLWKDRWNAYKTDLDGSGKYDAFTAGGVSAMLRLGLSNLKNGSGDAETYPSLERDKMKDRYVSFYRTVINGPKLDEGMQASEFWDTGERYVEGDDSGNTDGDTVPQIQKAGGKYGVAPILRAVEVSGS